QRSPARLLRPARTRRRPNSIRSAGCGRRDLISAKHTENQEAQGMPSLGFFVFAPPKAGEEEAQQQNGTARLGVLFERPNSAVKIPRNRGWKHRRFHRGDFRAETFTQPLCRNTTHSPAPRNPDRICLETRSHQRPPSENY